MKVCWLHESTSLEGALRELGFSKSSLKKTGLKRSVLNRVINKKSLVEIPEELFNKGLINPKYSGPLTPKIIEEKKELLALSKPSFIHCHPLNYFEGNNLLSFLREKKYFPYLEVNRKNYDRGLLYRIDYETSGLCLLTKSQSLYEEFRENHHEARKIYLAVVRGNYQASNELIHEISTSGSIVSVVESGKTVKIQILDKSFYEEHNLSLLKISLEGGARHQIRVQLSHSGYPLLGDELYGGEKGSFFGLHCLNYEWRDFSFSDSSFDINQFLTS